MKIQTVKIIFNLKGREKFIERYLKLLSKHKNYKFLFDLLIINENDNNISIQQINEIRIIKKNSLIEINGMNDIFKTLHDMKNIIENYKYVCFVEDDNFIFPYALRKCHNFLEKNKDFISCNGKSFLFGKKNNTNFQYLNFYNSPNNIISNNFNERNVKYNGALCYYSLFRSNYFIEITKKIKLIEDDNLSEVFFNYMALKLGKNYQINDLYLAREHPRPKIYNIPNKKTWLENNNLLVDINIIIDELTRSCENVDEILSNSIYKYLSLRLFQKNHSFFTVYLIRIKKFLFYFFHRKKILYFINIINK